jgi:hypothetical protein
MLFIRRAFAACIASFFRTNTFRMAAMIASLAASTMHAAAFDLFRDVGKSIEKSVQDVGKSIERTPNDIGKSIDGNKNLNPGGPVVEHSPTDPCKINGKLPQCNLDQIEK